MKHDLEEFIKKYSNKIDKKENIFNKYKDDILELRKHNLTYKLILEYLFEKDEEIKNKYKNRENTAITYLSKTIKKWLTDDTKKTTKNDVNTTPKETEKTQKNDTVEAVKKDENEAKDDDSNFAFDLLNNIKK